MKTARIEHVIKSNHGIRLTGNLNFIIFVGVVGLLAWKFMDSADKQEARKDIKESVEEDIKKSFTDGCGRNWLYELFRMPYPDSKWEPTWECKAEDNGNKETDGSEE